MAFEKFTQTGRGFKPKVSIWKRGQVGFNQGAIRVLDVARNGYIIFYYDPDTKRIGMEVTNDSKAEGANKIKVRTTGASVGAKAFLDYYQIDYEKTKSYELLSDEGSNLYVVDLTQGEISEEEEP